MATIDDLLNSLQKPFDKKTLDNNKDTWSRIGQRDSFLELGLKTTELESFVKEFISDNPYNNI